MSYYHESPKARSCTKIQSPLQRSINNYFAIFEAMYSQSPRLGGGISLVAYSRGLSLHLRRHRRLADSASSVQSAKIFAKSESLYLAWVRVVVRMLHFFG
eukprot:m.181974 g.181974  ORF g.181974 m.181974 type:complete len:100 (+) comp16638_c0_seq3:1895-2194(+)